MSQTIKQVLEEQAMALPYPKIHVVINPATGQNEPILNVLNNVYRPAGITWDISLTRKSGDATRSAAETAASGMDPVAAYGGDGTQAEVANGLLPAYPGRSCQEALAMPWRMN